MVWRRRKRPISPETITLPRSAHAEGGRRPRQLRREPLVTVGKKAGVGLPARARQPSTVKGVFVGGLRGRPPCPRVSYSITDGRKCDRCRPSNLIRCVRSTRAGGVAGTGL